MTKTDVLKVAVPAPLRILFDYLPPPGKAFPAAGSRVRVPFGRGERVGVVWGRGRPETQARNLKSVSEVLDDSPLLREADLKLLGWAARYYQHPLGEVAAAALPVRLRKGKSVANRARGWQVTDEGRRALDAGTVRFPRQLVVLRRLAESADGISQAALIAEISGDVRGVLMRLHRHGWIEVSDVAARSELVLGAGGDGPELNAEQLAAIREASGYLGQFQPFLLDGVTGSGKTEVYIELARQVIEHGRQVLILVPEISLTPQLVRRLTSRLNARFAMLHSGLSEGSRARSWFAAAVGEADILVGTRSALFTPMPRLGLVVVDEEHDTSFKQQEGFRYSARDLAVVKARLGSCPVVLGSATPSLESVANVERGRYRELRLVKRAGGAAPPDLATVDIRSQRLEGGLAPQLLRAMRAELVAGNQVLLFLNRRGYAPVVTCHACGWMAQCPHCDARLTWHQQANRLWCHHCGFQRGPFHSCPECEADDLRTLGQGTERLEETLARVFPDTSLVRVDRDATRRKGSLESILDAAESGAASLLVGTQMLAKGHHFPGVTLVGVLDADAGLFGVDFRAPERTAQLLYQVAGRAGRAVNPGRVLIQTRHPDHPLMQCLVQRGYDAFARAALEERRDAHLPPYSHQVLLRAESSASEPPRAFLSELAARLSAKVSGVEAWGPVPAPMERRAGHYRAHLLLQADDRRLLQNSLDDLLADISSVPGAKRIRWSVDVDPADLT